MPTQETGIFKDLSEKEDSKHSGDKSHEGQHVKRAGEPWSVFAHKYFSFQFNSRLKVSLSVRGQGVKNNYDTSDETVKKADQ